MSSNSDVEAGKSGLLSSSSGKTKQNEEQKEKPSKTVPFEETKLFKMITVAMYVCLVSGIGFLFALYHLFFWDSTMPPVPIVHGREAY